MPMPLGVLEFCHGFTPAILLSGADTIQGLGCLHVQHVSVFWDRHVYALTSSGRVPVVNAAAKSQSMGKLKGVGLLQPVMLENIDGFGAAETSYP